MRILNKKMSEPERLAHELFPLNRTLAGKDNITSLKILKKYNNKLQIKSFKSGTKCFDWKIPHEWNVKDAYIVKPDGKKICDFKKNNLHLVGYSHKLKKTIPLKILKKNLHSVKNHPDAIPYVTSYYKKTWGFCIEYKKKKLLKNGNYKVLINSSFKKGKMHYGEIFIKGKSKKEIIFTTYICHPSLANNEISGQVVNLFLSKHISVKKRRYSYRFLFMPETIGAIAYISKNLNDLKKNTIGGFILTCVGDERCFSYVPSRHGDTISDRIALKVFKKIKTKKKIYTWLDRGSDERQFCSPGVDLPFCSIMRSKYHTSDYPEYHTSLDKIGSVVTSKGLNGSISLYKKIIQQFEKSFFPLSAKKCEPFMTKHKLYHTLNDKFDWKSNDVKKTRDIMNFISHCDQKHSIEEISKKLNLRLDYTKKIFIFLLKKKLIHV